MSGRPRASTDNWPRSPTDPAKIEEWRAQAWRDFGVAMLIPDEIPETDWAFRQQIENHANQRYGQRRNGG